MILLFLLLGVDSRFHLQATPAHLIFLLYPTLFKPGAMTITQQWDSVVNVADGVHPFALRRSYFMDIGRHSACMHSFPFSLNLGSYVSRKQECVASSSKGTVMDSPSSHSSASELVPPQEKSAPHRHPVVTTYRSPVPRDADNPTDSDGDVASATSTLVRTAGSTTTWSDERFHTPVSAPTSEEPPSSYSLCHEGQSRVLESPDLSEERFLRKAAEDLTRSKVPADVQYPLFDSTSPSASDPGSTADYYVHRLLGSELPRDLQVVKDSSTSTSAHSYLDEGKSRLAQPDADPGVSSLTTTGTTQPIMLPVAVSDPRDFIIELILKAPYGRVTKQEIHDALTWSSNYEAVHGDLTEYLQSYHSIFVASPLDDTVTLGRAMLLNRSLTVRGDRRTMITVGASTGPGRGSVRVPAQQRKRTSAPPPAAHIGSISYSCVAVQLNLDQLEVVYRRRGYSTSQLFNVLHVSGPADSFDLFLFSCGAVVWWGMNRQEHWIVEDDFLNPETAALTIGVISRYHQRDITEVFPIWSTYETDYQYGKPSTSSDVVGSAFGFRPEVIDAALVRFAKLLGDDHYLIPAAEPARLQVMLTISHCLGVSARLEYYEHKTQSSHQHVIAIPSDFRGLWDYFSAKRRIDQLAGELHVVVLAIRTLKDTPDFLWEMPWLRTYYDLTDAEHASDHRLSWFTSRSDALLEQLAMVKDRHYRLFMLGSDVFLIALLILDVIFMTSRLIVKLYFKVEDP